MAGRAMPILQLFLVLAHLISSFSTKRSIEASNSPLIAAARKSCLSLAETRKSNLRHIAMLQVDCQFHARNAIVITRELFQLLHDFGLGLVADVSVSG